MSSLFPDDRPTARPAAKPHFRRRPKVQDAELPPLDPGFVLAHCDGGSRGNPGPAGFGAVVSDADGETLAELSEFLGIVTNNVAEYSGLLAVLDWALTHNHPRLRVVSDSELMVKQIQGKYRVNSPDLKPLHEEAGRRIARLEKFQIFHALRHKNQVADRLANEAMDRGTGRQPTSTPAKATPYPDRASAPPAPASFGGLQQTAPAPKPPSAPAQMLRGFVRDGAIHLLGGNTLPDGIFVKIIPE